MLPQKVLRAGDVTYLVGTKGIHTLEGADLWWVPGGLLAPVACISADGQWVVVADIFKGVHVLRMDAVQETWCHFKSEKAPTAMVITEADEARVVVLVADRHGDVTRIVMAGRAVEESAVVTGHVSIVTDMAVSGDLLVTADRDEKLRVTSLAKPHAIQAFLLGHTEYVAAVGVAHGGRFAVSASGDGSLRTWRLDVASSATKDTLVATLALDPAVYGRLMRAERILRREGVDADGEGGREEIEEYEVLGIEPLALCMVDAARGVLVFDRSSRVLVFAVGADGALEVVRDLALPAAELVVDVARGGDASALVLCNAGWNCPLYSVGLGADAQPELLHSVEARLTVPFYNEWLWKGLLRKDVHGQLPKAVAVARKRELEGEKPL